MSRVDTLLRDMTIEEKLGQLTMIAAGYAVTGPVIAGDSTESIRTGRLGNLLNMVGADHIHEMQRLAVEESRLGIPLMIGFDVVHGHRTMFPVPIGEASAFDPELWERTAREAAVEATRDGLAMVFAPMLDVSRDPRWGRTVEGSGEDPFVASRMAEAKIRGFQGSDLAAADAVAAVAKHFCAYGPVTAGREYASVDISDRTLHEVHLPSFEAAVATGVAAVMPAFTDLAGIPMTVHVPLLRGWLRQRLGFDGVIVSDYNAIAELIRHGVAADLVEAAALALNAGVDIDMMADAYRRGLPDALKRGLVVMETIDESVRRVLVLKERLGLFDDPYRRGVVSAGKPDDSHAREVARDAGRRSIVLLKNDADILPLTKGAKRIAVVGPLADARGEMRGPWWAAAEPNSGVTVLDGVLAAYPGAEVTYASGVSIDGDDAGGLQAAVDLCHAADVVLLCIGEAATMSGEAASRAHPGLPGRQRELAEAVLDTGRPVVAILFSGRPLVVPWLAERVAALLAVWFPGTETGHAVADVLRGRVSPSARLPMAWPRAVGQIPIFFAQRPTGRSADPKDHFTSKYLDVPNSPLFPFGYGLTYGRFTYADLKVGPSSVGSEDAIGIEVTVANEGRAAAMETVFLFAHDKLASVARPVLELKGFTKITLQPGEKGTVRFSLPAAELRFLGQDLKPVFEPGEVEILVGPCADRLQLLVATIELVSASSSKRVA